MGSSWDMLYYQLMCVIKLPKSVHGIFTFNNHIIEGINTICINTCIVYTCMYRTCIYMHKTSVCIYNILIHMYMYNVYTCMYMYIVCICIRYLVAGI